MSTAVQPEKILKDLQKLWIDLGKEDSQKGSAGVLRACAMTLIAAVEEEADAQAVGETIANLVHQHPSRVIVMRITADQAPHLDARVFAQCWMPFGRRQQICCEQIEITASEPRVADLPNLVLGLMAPDLPVVLWSRGERLCRDASFQQLFPLTNKIIVDSASFSDPDVALKFIRRVISGGSNVADLAWTRLTHLREIIAQIFERENALAHLHSLQRVAISYEGRTPVDATTMPTWLHYLMAWFRTTLPIPVDPVYRGTAAEYSIAGISIEGPGFRGSVELHDAVADVTVNELTRRIAFPKRSDCDLLREELSVVRVDEIFRRVIA